MREPNSIGFWRRNSIEGLRLTLAATFIIARDDPESLAAFKQNESDLRQLEQRERKICARAERIRRLEK